MRRVGATTAGAMILTLACQALCGQPASGSAQPRGRPAAGDAFRFVVIGDTRTPGGKWATVKPPEVSPAFLKLIEQINLTSPDLIVNVGDLVMGHRDRASLIRQWEAFDKALLGCDPPMYLVAGNHEVRNEMDAEIYRRRYGPLWYAFDHKGAHFIVLCSEVPTETGRIGPEQLKWLADDLTANAHRGPTYVFVHQPFWTYGGPTPAVASRARKEGLYQLWMDSVHPLLVRHKVDVVFGGHWHSYLSQNIDGVRYVVTGGGGAELRDFKVPPEVLGRFHHYLTVAVRDGRTHVGVARLDGVVPQDVVTPASIREGNKTRFTYDTMQTDFGAFEGKMLPRPGVKDGSGHIWVEPKGGNPGTFIMVNMYHVFYDAAAGELHRAGAAAIAKRLTLPGNPKDILDVEFRADYANWRTDRTPESSVWLMVVPADSWDHAGGYVGPGDYELSQPAPALYVQQFTTEVEPGWFPDAEVMPRHPTRAPPKGGAYPIEWAAAKADRDRLLAALLAHAGQKVAFVVQVRNDVANTSVWGHLDNIVVNVKTQRDQWVRMLTE